jgi:ankyrin repeat protein
MATANAGGDRSFRTLIKAAMVKIRILSTMNEMGLQKALARAVAANDLVGAKDALTKGAWVNARSPAGSTCLMEASRLGHVSIVKLLIKQNATVNAVNFQNNTALHYAYQMQQYQVRACVCLCVCVCACV